jgi:hypothetical protein
MTVKEDPRCGTVPPSVEIERQIKRLAVVDLWVLWRP